MIQHSLNEHLLNEINKRNGDNTLNVAPMIFYTMFCIVSMFGKFMFQLNDGIVKKFNPILARFNITVISNVIHPAIQRTLAVLSSEAPLFGFFLYSLLADIIKYMVNIPQAVVAILQQHNM